MASITPGGRNPLHVSLGRFPPQAISAKLKHGSHLERGRWIPGAALRCVLITV